MIEVESFQNLEEIIGERNFKNLNTVFHSIFDEIQGYLNLRPVNRNVEVTIRNKPIENGLKNKGIFDIGIDRFIQDNLLILEINRNYDRFLEFILLREIYNLFIPNRLKNYEIIQIIINHIIMTHLSKSDLIDEWRALIRRNLEDYDPLSTGINRLTPFDRLEKIFSFTGDTGTLTPIQFLAV